MIVKAVDVTDQEVLSSLKRDLIDKDSIVSHAHFQGLQAKLGRSSGAPSCASVSRPWRETASSS